MTKETRPQRICDVCGQVDDHPRHVIAFGPGMPVNQQHLKAVYASDLSDEDKESIATDVLDTTVQQRHMDCCREAGCPDGSCNAIADTGAADLRGKALLKHLTSGAVDDIAQTVNEISQTGTEQEN